MTRATSGWHSFETHVNRFALLILSAHQQLDLSILHGDGTNETRKQTVVKTAIHTLRERVERTLAWEDKFKRLLLRFEHQQHRHYGMKLMAYTLINLRQFCAT